MTLVRGAASGGTTSPLALGPIPPRFSYTQMGALAGGKYSCPRSYGYNYRASLPFKSSPALVMGRAFDELVNSFFTWRMAGTELSEARLNVAGTVADTWACAVADSGLTLSPDNDAAYLAALERALVAFVDHERDVIPFSVQEKHVLTVTNGDHVIESVGYSDRIDADGVIVDHKLSGSKRWNAAGEWDQDWLTERRDQGVLYWLSRLAVAKRVLVGGEDHPSSPPIVPTFRLVVTYTRKGAKTAEVRSVDLGFNGIDQERVLTRMREADSIKQSGVYPARPGDACVFCSYTEQCRADFAAGNDPFTGCAA